MSIDGPKKSRGRPAVDSEAVKVRIQQPLLGQLDAWRGLTSRPEAIRQILEEKLGKGE